MRITPPHKKFRVTHPHLPPIQNFDKIDGYYEFIEKGVRLFCLATSGMGWEHVSVSIPNASRCPTWEEMCFVKNRFWKPTESVVQYHPAKSEYVNNHPYCLHLWKPVGKKYPLPPSIMVGVKKK